MIVIYTKQVTNRIKYAFDFVFANYFGIAYEIILDANISKESDKIYLSYAAEKHDGFFSVFQEDLLLKEDIVPQKLFVSTIHEMPVFFQTTDHYDLPFDIFSAIFYLVTRYEEYLPHAKDEHDRYKSSNSILANPAFNFSPIVEIWLDFFKQELLKINATIPFKKHEFEYQPTFDIDNAFQYLGRNWFKKPPNIFNATCIKVLLKKEKDPFDTFDFIHQEIIKHQLKPIFFFLMSDEDKNDSNVSPDSSLLHFQIKALSQYPIGIHPSYNTTTVEKVKDEKELLSQITEQPITLSRQHFLRLKFPETIRNLKENNIQKDYSLAYPNIPGFRAGYSREINFFDLAKNEPTSFILQPTCWMDATFEYYQNNLTNDEMSINALASNTKDHLRIPSTPLKNKKTDIDEILDKFLPILYLLKKNNGKLVLIFHNDLLAIDKFQRIFIKINQLAKQ